MKNLKNNQIIESNKKLEENNNFNLGKVVIRYNISKAEIEYYFIGSREVEAYELAALKQDLTATKRLGRQINP